MTRKQSFAIFLKTGFDVRKCNLSHETIDQIMGSYTEDAQALLRDIPGAKRLCNPKNKGQYLDREYSLLLETALKYQDETRKRSVKIQVYNLSSGFGRWLSKNYEKGKDGIVIKFKGSLESAGKAAEYLSRRGKVNAVAFN